MSDYDWSYFIRKIYIKTSKETLFDMWISPENITKFWLSDAKYYDPETAKPQNYPKAGDNYTWTFASGSTMSGKILEIEENRKFKFTFGKTYQDSDEYVHVTLLFGGNDKEAWIELLQENIGLDEFGKVRYHLSCQLGWLHALLNLKSVIETKHDLREQEAIRVIETTSYGIPIENSSFNVE